VELSLFYYVIFLFIVFLFLCCLCYHIIWWIKMNNIMSILSGWARHTDAARPSLAAVFEFKLAALIYQCLRGLAPRYLSDYIQRVADSNRRRLRSSSSSQLVIWHTRLSTVGDRAFPVAGSRLLNSLPLDVTSTVV